MSTGIAERIAERIRTPEPEAETAYREMIFELAGGKDIPVDDVREVMEAGLRTPDDLQADLDRAEKRLRAFREIEEAETLKTQFEEALKKYDTACKALNKFNKEIEEKGARLRHEYANARGQYESLVTQYHGITGAARGVLWDTSPLAGTLEPIEAEQSERAYNDPQFITFN